MEEAKSKLRVNRYAHLLYWEQNCYLFHGESNKVYKIPYKLFKALKQEKIDEIEPSYIDILTSEQILVPEQFNEYEESKIKFQKAKYLDSSVSSYSLTIGTSMNCNFGCFYCYEQGVKEEGTIAMPRQVADQTLEFIKRNVPQSTPLKITWYGGEPLLGLDSILYISQSLINLGYQIEGGIITNGYLLTSQTAEQLVKEANVHFAQITIDGPRNIHNKRRVLKGGGPTYDVIMDNIKNASKFISNISVRINVDKSNRDYLYDLLEELKSMPSNVLPSIAPVREENSTFSNEERKREILFSEQEFAEFTKEFLWAIKRTTLEPFFGCSAIQENSYVIDADGYLYKCWNEIGRREQSVGDVWEGITNYELYKKWLSFGDSDFPESCQSCSVFPSCRGGKCPYNILYPESGDGHWCMPEKFIFDDLLIWYIEREIPQNSIINLDENYIYQYNYSINTNAVPQQCQNYCYCVSDKQVANSVDNTSSNCSNYCYCISDKQT